MRTIPLILVLVLAAACSKDVAREKAISFSRSGCFGSCPSYTITLFPDGKYIWEGGRFVARSGFHRGDLGPDVFGQVMQVLENARYREFNDHYEWGDGCEQEMTDAPSAGFNVQSEFETKEIDHYMGCQGFEREDELFALERRMDELLGTEPFIEGPDIAPENSISISRSSCDGNCSAYSFTLFADGGYLWEGRSDVARAGFHRGKYEPGMFARVMETLTDARYLEWEENLDVYQSPDCDMSYPARSQLIRLDVRSEFGEKRIFHDLGCNSYDREEELLALESRIDELLNTEAFVENR